MNAEEIKLIVEHTPRLIDRLIEGFEDESTAPGPNESKSSVMLGYVLLFPAVAVGGLIIGYALGILFH